jgi:recombination protein RecT
MAAEREPIPDGADRRRAIVRSATEIRRELDQMSQQLQAALPEGVPVGRFNGIVMTAIQQTPDLALCERRSLLISVMRCAADGLLPDGREAVIAPYRDRKRDVMTAQYMPMVAGILKRARNSGEITGVSCAAVYEKDAFDYELGDEEFIRHRPAWGERGALIGAYAIVRCRDGSLYRDVMDKHEIERRRAASSAPDSPAWTTWYDEQACKVVLRHCLKRAPQSNVLDRLLGTETSASPANPAKEMAGKQMPDPASHERSVFQLKCEAEEAIRSAETEELINQAFRAAVAEFQKLGVPLPIEIEAAKFERVEALRQKANATA